MFQWSTIRVEIACDATKSENELSLTYRLCYVETVIRCSQRGVLNQRIRVVVGRYVEQIHVGQSHVQWRVVLCGGICGVACAQVQRGSNLLPALFETWLSLYGHNGLKEATMFVPFKNFAKDLKWLFFNEFTASTWLVDLPFQLRFASSSLILPGKEPSAIFICVPKLVRS